MNSKRNSTFGVAYFVTCLVPSAVIAVMLCITSCEGDEPTAGFHNESSLPSSHMSSEGVGDNLSGAIRKLGRSISELEAVIALSDKRRIRNGGNGWDVLLEGARAYSPSDRRKEPLAILFEETGLGSGAYPYSTSLSLSERDELTAAIQASSEAKRVAVEANSYDVCVAPAEGTRPPEHAFEINTFFVLLGNRAHALHALDRYEESCDAAYLCFELAMKTHAGSNLASTFITTKTRYVAIDALMRVTEGGGTSSDKTKAVVNKALKTLNNKYVEATSRTYMEGEGIYAISQAKAVLDRAQYIARGAHGRRGCGSPGISQEDHTELIEDIEKSVCILSHLAFIIPYCPDEKLGLSNAKPSSNVWNSYRRTMGSTNPEDVGGEVLGILNALARYEVNQAVMHMAVEIRSLDIRCSSIGDLKDALSGMNEMNEGYRIFIVGKEAVVRLANTHPVAEHTVFGGNYAYRIQLLGRG